MRPLTVCLLICWTSYLAPSLLAQSHVYYSSWALPQNGMNRVDTDGTNRTYLFATSGNRGIALDLVNQYLYWVDHTDRTIRRINLNGSGNVNITAVTSGVIDLALDPNGQRIFFTDTNTDQVTRVDYDGSNKTDVISGQDPRGIDYDAASDRIFWADAAAKTINVVQPDGSGSQVVLALSGTPQDMVLDKVNQHIYWVENSNQIRRANYDGTSVITVATVQTTTSIAIDNVNNKIYRHDRGANAIKRMNFNGTNEETVLSGNVGLSGLALDINEVLPPSNGDAFVTTWKTDHPGSSCSSCITIPTMGGGYNYNVDWDNDGTVDQSGVMGDVTHDFGVPGTYTIGITGDFPRIYFADGGDKEKIQSIDQWGSIDWQSMESAFWGCTNLTSAATDAPSLLAVTNLDYMFTNATSFNSDLSSWNTTQVIDYYGMFQGASAFNQSLAAWNIAGAASGGMDGMLNDAGLSLQNYDNTLISWAAQGVDNVTLGANNLEYCDGKNARDALIAAGWNIAGDAYECSAIWNNNQGGNLWTTPGNWDTGSLPKPNNPVFINTNILATVPMNFSAESESVELSNGGTLRLLAGASLTCTGAGVDIQTPDARLEGTGTVVANVLHPAGLIAPGASPGILTIDGDYLNTGGTLDIEVDGTTAGTEYDRIVVTGTTSLNAAGPTRLNLTFGYTPQVGDFYDILTSGTISGTINTAFVTINGGDVGSVTITKPDPTTIRVTVASLLPVAWLDFTATPQDRSVYLQWATASEENNAYFAVEHATDGHHFMDVGKVNGAGDTQERRDYSFVHLHPSSGLNYYRLRQVDHDGAFTYSPILKVQLDKTAQPFQLFPNPVQDELQVTFDAALQPTYLQLRHLAGQVLLHRTLSPEQTTLSISTASLPAGIYTLEVRNENRVWYQRLVKG